MESNLSLPYIRTFRFLMFTPGNKEVWGLPALFEAEPGTSKTSRARFAAKLFGMPCKTLSPGLHGEGAFGVVMVPTQHGKRTYLDSPPPYWVRTFRDDEDQPIPGLVMVDELLAAMGALRPPLLGLIDERMIGDTFLGGPVRVLGFTNSADACGTDPLTPQLSNRFLHPKWYAPSATELGEHFLTGTDLSKVQVELDPIEEQKRVMAIWEQYRTPAAALVSKYLESNPGEMHRQPKLNTPGAGGAWPSRRSWELAIRVLAGGRLHGLSVEEINNMLEWTIGATSAGTFQTYLAKMDLPNPADVVDGKVSILPLDPTRLDKTYVTLDACAAFVISDTSPAKAKRGVALWTILETIGKSTPDLMMKPAQTLLKARVMAPMSAIAVLGKHEALANLFKKFQ